jgi:hypothetical protein
MKAKHFGVFLALLTVAAVTKEMLTQREFQKSKVTVIVFDESHKPVSGTKVTLFYCEARNPNAIVKVEGLTDKEGKFIGEGYCSGSYGVDIRKDGFYPSGLGAPQLTNIVDGKWLPWNPTCETILRPIGKPVALYAKTVNIQIPVLNEPCGFDLEAGDWVSPYGNGMKKDFIFTIHQDWRAFQNYDVLGELAFKNPLDGFQNAPQFEVGKYSEFKWEREAPKNDYQPKFQLQNSWHGDKGITRSFKFKDGVWEGYFFRVRTVEQDGQIVSTHYGKIRGGIAVYPDNKSGKPKIVFTYYFNPTPNYRNLEWDTKKNLFGGLTDMETPSEP